MSLRKNWIPVLLGCVLGRIVGIAAVFARNRTLNQATSQRVRRPKSEVEGELHLLLFSCAKPFAFRSITSLIMLLCFSTTVIAQDSLSLFTETDMLSLFTRIESVIQKKESKWRLEKKIIHSSQALFTWSSDEGSVLVSIAITGNVDASKAYFKEETSKFEKGIDTKVSRTELKGLGDESYLWSRHNDLGHSSVLFRKGEAVVRVFAPSSETAKRFAQYVADRIPPSGRNDESQVALTIEQALSKLNQFVGQWELTYDIPNWRKKRPDPIIPITPLMSDDGSREITIVRSDSNTISFSFSASVLNIATGKTATESCRIKLKYDAQSNKYLLTITPSFGMAITDLPLSYSENVFSGAGSSFAVTKDKEFDKRVKEMKIPARASIILSKEGEHIWEIKAGQLLLPAYGFTFSRKR